MNPTLLRYASEGYQIVFCPKGIRAWYLPALENSLLYEGSNFAALLRVLDEHYPKRNDE